MKTDMAFLFAMVSTIFYVVVMSLPDNQSPPTSPVLISNAPCEVYKIVDNRRSIYLSPNCNISVR